jgi:L-cystine uptake protein TcyP (sodium:dicarboxylate symporter family)
MAKKSRRTRRQEKVTTASNASVAETPASTIAQKAVNFVGEYAYVYKELRTVLIIAVIMFAVLFGLSYLLY